MVSGPVKGGPPAVDDRRNDPLVIAHRGFAGVFPENTLAAVRQASRGASKSAGFGGTGGADAIELDVVPAAGGEPVVFHDRTLGRLTDVPTNRRSQPVWETPVETLRGLSVLDTRESVPLFADVMDAIPADVGVNVELKHPGTGQPRRELDTGERARGRERWAGLVERVLDILADHDNELLFSSSYEGALAAVHDASDAALAYLFWNSIEAGLAITRRYDCEAVHPPMDMIRGTELFNSGYIPTGPFSATDLVARAHEEGRAVNVWTVTDWYQADQLRGAGVDGIITDYPLFGPADAGDGFSIPVRAADRTAEAETTVSDPSNVVPGTDAV